MFSGNPNDCYSWWKIPHLSETVYAGEFLESYRSRMEVELRNYNMLEFNLFRRAKITFTGKDTMHMELPDTCDPPARKARILVEYFHKVFCERRNGSQGRAGFHRRKREQIRENAAHADWQEVENVLESVKLSNGEESAGSRRKPSKEKTQEGFRG